MIQRTNVGIFGKINAGKSTLMNVITQQTTSIVDITPGTTTDIKIALLEIHEIGPVKLFDTAGIDEISNLGKKKKLKTIAALKECDLVLLVIDPSCDTKDNLEIINLAKNHQKQLLIIYNIFSKKQSDKNLNYLKPSLSVDLLDKNAKNIIFEFIKTNFISQKKSLDIFSFLNTSDIVFLNIPMDEETPEKRLLRPQSFIQENLIRRYVSTFGYRMNLKLARENDLGEYQRFKEALNLLKKNNNLKLLITDSQAIDIIHPWTLDEKGESLVDITTFSIIMAYIQTQGQLQKLTQGIEALKKLKNNDRILIAEACNHNRIKEDIGTVQIPKKIKTYFSKDNIFIDHAFGREFSTIDLEKYKLVIHCGGCMIDKQKMQSRLTDLIKSTIPITNYGLVLSYLQSPLAFQRVIKPFI